MTQEQTLLQQCRTMLANYAAYDAALGDLEDAAFTLTLVEKIDAALEKAWPERRA